MDMAQKGYDHFDNNLFHKNWAEGVRMTIISFPLLRDVVLNEEPT